MCGQELYLAVDNSDADTDFGERDTIVVASPGFEGQPGCTVKLPDTRR